MIDEEYSAGRRFALRRLESLDHRCHDIMSTSMAVVVLRYKERTHKKSLTHNNCLLALLSATLRPWDLPCLRKISSYKTAVSQTPNCNCMEASKNSTMLKWITCRLDATNRGSCFRNKSQSVCLSLTCSGVVPKRPKISLSFSY